MYIALVVCLCVFQVPIPSFNLWSTDAAPEVLHPRPTWRDATTREGRRCPRVPPRLATWLFIFFGQSCFGTPQQNFAPPWISMLHVAWHLQPLPSIGLLSPNTTSVPRYTLLLLLLHAIAVSVWFPKKKKKGERKNYCSGVFHVALNILEMKRSNFLDFFFFFLRLSSLK